MCCVMYSELNWQQFNMSKIRLRALNCKNITSSPIHSDLNITSLAVSWKLHEIIFNNSNILNNQKCLFRVNFCKKILNIKNILFKKKYTHILYNKIITKYNKKNFTNVKIIINNNKTNIILLNQNNDYLLLKKKKIKKNTKYNFNF